MTAAKTAWLVCSHGGHLTEMLTLAGAFRDFEVVYLTYASDRAPAAGRVQAMPDFTRRPVLILPFCLILLRLILRERPSIIVSTGAEIAIPVFYLAKLLRIKTVFIETLSRVRSKSTSGRLIYWLADAFYVQWPSMLNVYGRKARYRGAVLGIGE